MLSYTRSLVSMLAIYTTFTLALPQDLAGKPIGGPKLTGCDISKAVLPLPATAASAGMSVPAGVKPAFIALGRGTQNYTCQSGVYANNLATAELYDASCAFNTPLYTQISKLALQVPVAQSFPAQVTSLIGSLKLGQHYYQVLTPGANSSNPVFDFRATKKGDFVGAARVTSTPNPTGASNVAWVQLKNVAGTLAKDVFRVETAGGVPPASCTTEGEVLNVDYAALYWFFF